MAIKRGILLNDYWDLEISPVRDTEDKIVSGLRIAPVVVQNQRLLMTFSKGDLKPEPTMGVAVHLYAEADDKSSLAREIRAQYHQDGLKISTLRIDNSGVTINANYE